MRVEAEFIFFFTLLMLGRGSSNHHGTDSETSMKTSTSGRGFESSNRGALTGILYGNSFVSIEIRSEFLSSSAVHTHSSGWSSRPCATVVLPSSRPRRMGPSAKRCVDALIIFQQLVDETVSGDPSITIMSSNSFTVEFIDAFFGIPSEISDERPRASKEKKNERAPRYRSWISPSTSTI